MFLYRNRASNMSREKERCEKDIFLECTEPLECSEPALSIFFIKRKFPILLSSSTYSYNLTIVSANSVSFCFF